MSDRFNVSDTEMEGLKIIQRNLIRDERGYFERLYCLKEFAAMIPQKIIVQINHTHTVKQGVVRGMHFQHSPHCDAKFVSCMRGKVFDVAVDLRHSSPTFLQWHAQILSADNHTSLLIPEGFAHGFQTLEDNCEMLYFHTAEYRPTTEGAINAQDPKLDICWPQVITEMSERDIAHPMLSHDFKGLKP